MDNGLKYTMLVLEGLEISHRIERSDSEIAELIYGLMIENAQLDEGIVDTIKEKAAAFADKVKDSAKNILPSITQKFDNTLAQVRAKQGDEVADAIESQMNKKAGSNWRSNSVKIAAALAVASSLAQASPAQARDMYMRMSPFQAQQMQMQRQADWARHHRMDSFRNRGMQGYYQQGGDYDDYQYQQGNDPAAFAVGVMIGAALGAALAQHHR
jgi:gas vesicle protein